MLLLGGDWEGGRRMTLGLPCCRDKGVLVPAPPKPLFLHLTSFEGTEEENYSQAIYQ